MSSTFAKVTTLVVAPPDPYKYVNYTQGMLLGVDDFIQEHTYLAEHSNWLTRELLGYGTSCGLQISTDIDSTQGPYVTVSPGVAISPQGQIIRVPSAQCAYLNDWFASNKQEAGDLTEGSVTVYIVLSYCATDSDNIPVAGEAGHYAETPTIPSRISDDFTLDLRLTAPRQEEEEAIRRFIAWLRKIRVSTRQEETYSEPAHFLEVLRKAATQDETKTVATFMTQPPPSDLVIPVASAPHYWQKAFLVWVTELRPRWCQKNVAGEDAIILTKLQMHIQQSPNGNWSIVLPKHGHAVHIHEEERPYLLHAQLTQEWLRTNQHETTPIDLHITEIEETTIDETIQIENIAPFMNGDITSTKSGSTTVQGLQNMPIAPDKPTKGQVLTFNGKHWQATDLPQVSIAESIEAPQEQGNYVVVAAGHIRCDGSSTHPTYNDLAAQSHTDGQVTVRFKGYTQPEHTPYIVSILPVWNPRIHLYNVFLEHFAEDFFTLHVVNQHGDVIRMGELKQLELIIEVKNYTPVPAATEEAQSRKRKR